MATAAALNAVHKMKAAQLDRPTIETAELAGILDEELHLSEMVTALRRCDQLLEQRGVSVEQRDLVIKSLAWLEGPTSTPVADTIIGTAP